MAPEPGAGAGAGATPQCRTPNTSEEGRATVPGIGRKEEERATVPGVWRVGR